jgi:hypothetical protein
MKKQNANKWAFKKATITELDKDQMLVLVGGALNLYIGSVQGEMQNTFRTKV